MASINELDGNEDGMKTLSSRFERQTISGMIGTIALCLGLLTTQAAAQTSEALSITSLVRTAHKGIET